MKRFALPLIAAATAIASPALAQQAGPVPAIEAGHTLLTVSADGKSERAPDLAVFNAGVTTQGKTAGEALGANSAAMNRVIASLKRAGIADRDIQTSNLSINPVYSEPRRLPDGSTEQRAPEIVGYQVNNSVSVRQRQLGDYGKVIDTLVAAGANQVNGPSFSLDKPDAALDAARTEAIGKARARADLYARAAGLKVMRIVSISEGGGYAPPPMPVMYRMVAQDSAAAPVAAGEVSLNVNVTVQFELAP
ncbi:SIMPL domain-containing protein [Novosphingobium sp. G106]|uniref:SIMPL domain-containing protein n=1 Tax=Novosphingobium sp. G106 TaxID=2849500 RepID=UPI001C2DEEE1|nr:SIMPL domain-containing protein [Novosphingobium sp. G106]MBV1686490.1 SIMPL domain-containing protein [Novosphingobium sp. G106]